MEHLEKMVEFQLDSQQKSARGHPEENTENRAIHGFLQVNIVNFVNVFGAGNREGTRISVAAF